MKRKQIDAQLVSSLLSYEPETGVLRWKPRGESYFASEKSYKTWNSRFAGSIAGNIHVDAQGYQKIVVRVLGVNYCAHRLAWTIQTGDQPPVQIDHKNRVATDNRWENLIDASGLNQRNKSMQPSNTSGYTGVSWHKGTQKWRARIAGLDGKEKSLGYYQNKMDAARAVEAKRQEFGYSAEHGKSPAYYRIDGGDELIEQTEGREVSA